MITKLLVVLFSLFLFSSLLRCEEAPVFRAGAFAADVTPQQFPLNMPGVFSGNLAEGANDALHARALVLDDGKTSFALVLVDNLGLSPSLIIEAKQLASEKTGIPA